MRPPRATGDVLVDSRRTLIGVVTPAVDVIRPSTSGAIRPAARLECCVELAGPGRGVAPRVAAHVKGFDRVAGRERVTRHLQSLRQAARRAGDETGRCHRVVVGGDHPVRPTAGDRPVGIQIRGRRVGEDQRHLMAADVGRSVCQHKIVPADAVTQSVKAG